MIVFDYEADLELVQRSAMAQSETLMNDEEIFSTQLTIAAFTVVVIIVGTILIVQLPYEIVKIVIATFIGFVTSTSVVLVLKLDKFYS